MPDSCRVRIAESEPRHTRVQIKSQAIGLAFGTTIVSSIGKHSNVEQRDRLEVFVGRRKLVMVEVVVARLFDHILQRDKADLILLQALLQDGNRLFDR